MLCGDVHPLPFADDGVLFRCDAFEPFDGARGEGLVAVSAAVAEKDGDNSVDEQKVDGRVREFGGRRFCPFCSLLRGDFAFGVCFCAGFNF